MAEFAPSAIQAVYSTVHARIPSAKLSGIIGDRAHTYGYHRGRRFVGPGDYSATRDDDRKGNDSAASALDISLPPAEMVAVTSRLITAARAHDPRLNALREFFGTIDGRNVTGIDVRANPTRWVTSDKSHLWHVHLSFYRRWCEDGPELAKIADVITGRPAGGAGGTDDFLGEIMALNKNSADYKAFMADVRANCKSAMIDFTGIDGDKKAHAIQTIVRAEFTRHESRFWGDRAAVVHQLHTYLSRIPGFRPLPDDK